MAPAHLTMLHFHRQAIAIVRSTNQHFINAPLSLRTSKKTQIPPISALLGTNPLSKFIVSIRLSHLCIAETSTLAQLPRCSKASLLELIECHQSMGADLVRNFLNQHWC